MAENIKEEFEQEYPEFNCVSCGVNTLYIGEYYMVHKKIWHTVTLRKERKRMLCIGCVESRLGRILNFNDFTDAPINNIMWEEKSSRLQSRITSYALN